MEDASSFLLIDSQSGLATGAEVCCAAAGFALGITRLAESIDSDSGALRAFVHARVI